MMPLSIEVKDPAKINLSGATDEIIRSLAFLADPPKISMFA